MTSAAAGVPDVGLGGAVCGGGAGLPLPRHGGGLGLRAGHQLPPPPPCHPRPPAADPHQPPADRDHHQLQGGRQAVRPPGGLSWDCLVVFTILPLQGVLAQQRWRAGPLLHSLLAQLRPLLAHPYHNIRCRLAAALTNIFAFDLEFEGHGNANKSSPHEEEFVREVLPLLAPLEEAGAGEGREAALRLLQTLAKWVAGSCLAGVRGPAPCLLRLLPHLLGQDWQEADPQLAGDCRLALAGLVTTMQQVADPGVVSGVPGDSPPQQLHGAVQRPAEAQAGQHGHGGAE